MNTDPLYKIILKNLYKFFTDRLLFLTIFVAVLFYILSSRLFDLQIVKGEEYSMGLSKTFAVEVALPAQRGDIYDRYGRPLAINQFVYNLKMDPSVSVPSATLNKAILDLITLLEENGESYLDELPISLSPPYEYTFYGDNSERSIALWLKNMDLKEELTADEAMDALRVKFGIDPKEPEPGYVRVSDSDARKIISLRSKIYMVRYYSYNPVTVAQNLSLETITRVEEDPERYISIFSDVEAQRYYPYGKYLSHIIGYVRQVDQNDLDANPDKGYKPTDIIGKTGIEKSFEDSLRGENGSLTIIKNAMARRVGEIEGSRTDPVQGHDVFLTIDARLQQKGYEILEDTLKNVLIARLTLRSTKEAPLTPAELLSSLVGANNISPVRLFVSAGAASREIREYVLDKDPTADHSTRAGRLDINKIISQGIADGEIPVKTAIMLLFEQGIISGDEAYVERFTEGRVSPLTLLVEKISIGEITPQMTNADPSTGSLVIVDVKTGDILAAPTYPSYDTNDFISNFNQTYLALADDPTTPMYNRPFYEGRAPGSTFKMITAAAGLETGVIDRTTRIRDEVLFTAAGVPYLSCWNKSGHGHITVEQAIEGSCNYFFSETAYRIGNTKSGNKLDSIGALNKYMSYFGLDEGVGVEIGEAYKQKSPMNMSSPEKNESRYGEDWYDGNTVATAIGQYLNNYTSAVMARYISIIATKGDKHNLHLLDKISGPEGITPYEPVYEYIGDDLNPSTWDIIHSGMYLVTHGPTGTGVSAFKNFPITVAGKTGTAEENKQRLNHTSFGGFAPYENPEVAVYVSIPFSDTTASPAPAMAAAREMLSAYYDLNKERQAPPKTNNLY